jgi:transcriptional repressor NrdR
VIKRDGTREMFNRNKLLAGLSRAFEKRLTSSVKLEEIVATIERNLRSAGESEVRTSDLGESILRELAKIDEVAYVRFASVYRSFKDVASFEKELARLKNGS